jgi:transcriptional regulator with XRE-family HTH domain
MDTLGQYFQQRYIQVSSLAKTAGVPASTLYKYTSGRSSVWNMSIHTFSRLAHALGMTSDEFIEELKALENGNGAANR